MYLSLTTPYQNPPSGGYLQNYDYSALLSEGSASASRDAAGGIVSGGRFFSEYFLGGGCTGDSSPVRIGGIVLPYSSCLTERFTAWLKLNGGMGGPARKGRGGRCVATSFDAPELGAPPAIFASRASASFIAARTCCF